MRAILQHVSISYFCFSRQIRGFLADNRSTTMVSGAEIQRINEFFEESYDGTARPGFVEK